MGILLPAESAGSALEQVLRADRINAVSVNSIDELHTLISRQHLDILVVSQNLGGFFTGLDLIERLYADLSRPTVILVGQVEAAQERTAERLGVAARLDDADDVERLASTVRGRIAQMHLEQSWIPAAARRIAADADIVRPMPQLLTKLCSYLQEQTVSLSVLSEDIACDPRVTAELLRLANSTAMGLSRKVTSVHESIRFLGVRGTIAAVLGAGVMRSQKTFASALPELLRNWHQTRSLLVACTAASIAEHLENVSGETAHVLGLLQDLGVLVLARAAPRRYERIYKRTTTVAHVRLECLEREEFGVTHADVSAALLEKWEIPQPLVQAIFDHHEALPRPGRSEIDQRYLHAMRIGECVANLSDLRCAQRHQALAVLLAKYGVHRMEDCKYCFSTAALKAREQSQLFSVPVSDGDHIQSVLSELAQASETHHQPSPIPSSDAPESFKILIIEDSNGFSSWLSQFLKSQGYVTVEAADFDQAVSLIDGVDLILCDVHVGQDHGADLVERLRTFGNTAPVIMMSGDCTRKTVHRCISAGIVDFLIKPFELETVVEKIRHWISATSIMSIPGSPPLDAATMAAASHT